MIGYVQTSAIPFREIVDVCKLACLTLSISDIRYEIRDGIQNISPSYPGKNKWISIHRDILRAFKL